MEKDAYVLIWINGKKRIWPYFETQEFCLYDLSDSIIYLTDDEYIELEKELNDDD